MADINDIKFQRIVFFYDELSRHNIDFDVAVKFMEYVFNVSPAWITKIIKGYVPFEPSRLEHSDIDCQTIDAFVRKLYKKARTERLQSLSMPLPEAHDEIPAPEPKNQLKIFENN